jgi:hypothetical protein
MSFKILNWGWLERVGAEPSHGKFTKLPSPPDSDTYLLNVWRPDINPSIFNIHIIGM